MTIVVLFGEVDNGDAGEESRGDSTPVIHRLLPYPSPFKVIVVSMMSRGLCQKKVLTAPGIPRRSPIQVLAGLYVA